MVGTTTKDLPNLAMTNPPTGNIELKDKTDKGGKNALFCNFFFPIFYVPSTFVERNNIYIVLEIFGGFKLHEIYCRKKIRVLVFGAYQFLKV